ncbi:protein of unknown function [Methylacidimicrobium sp. AP8]|uniref:hypothetical protein n=1 Tax=Methylacidimicrobium sp. AP8 TaxID=2730359 RepID=UPI0018C13341|nr:hypothetical protein [Methylacidimicrobium sp. AP8]CAB4243492.1 protein of unknown function [Methylacidimicrobium sp. AP8]
MNLSTEDADATYRSLGLGKAPLRLDAESPDKAVAIGGEIPEYPRVLVGQDRYEAILNRLIASRLFPIRDNPSLFSATFLTTYFRERLRFAAYDAVLREEGSSELTASGRKPAKWRARLYRRALVQRLLTRIERRRLNSRPWLDQVWQKAVGPRIAAESQLVRIDRESCRAIIRSLNASLAFSLRRRPDLCSFLSEALGTPIREIRMVV